MRVSHYSFLFCFPRWPSMIDATANGFNGMWHHGMCHVRMTSSEWSDSESPRLRQKCETASAWGSQAESQCAVRCRLSVVRHPVTAPGPAERHLCCLVRKYWVVNGRSWDGWWRTGGRTVEGKNLKPRRYGTYLIRSSYSFFIAAYYSFPPFGRCSFTYVPGSTDLK
jgi:hypothetical protein